MFLIDLEQGRMIDDEELKASLANSKPYKQWIENLRIKLDDVQASRCRRCGAGVTDVRCWTASRPSATRRKTSSS